MALAVALACSVLATALAPTEAWAANLKTKTVPLDFTGDTLELEDGTVVDLDDFFGDAYEDGEIANEWASHGWKLVKDYRDDEDCWVYLILADGFTFRGGAEDFAIKLAKTRVGGAPRNTFIQLEGEATISIEGRDEDSAALKLVNGVTLHPSPTSSASTKKLTVTNRSTENGYGIHATSWTVADGIALNAEGPQAGIKLEPNNESDSDKGNLEARDGGVITATGTAADSMGVDAGGNIRLYSKNSTEGGKLYATGAGSVGAYARGNIVLDTENTSPGAVAKNVLEGTGGTSNSVGVHSLSTISVSSGSTIEGIGEDVGVQAGTQGSANGKLEVTEGSTVKTDNGVAVFGELHAANSTFDVKAQPGQNGSAALRVHGGKIAIDGGEFNLTAGGPGSVGLYLEDLTNLPTFEAKDVEFLATGEQVGVLVKGSGSQPTYPSPIKLDPNLAVVGGWLGSANYANPDARTVWSYSPDGKLGVDPSTFEPQGASQTVKFLPNPKYWLKVDDKTLFASNDPTDIVDAEIPGLARFSVADRTLALFGGSIPEKAEGFDPTSLPTARGIVARGLTEGSQVGALTVATEGGFLVEGEDGVPAISVQGPVRFAGSDESALSVIGPVQTSFDRANRPGSFALESGRMSVFAIGDSGAAFSTASAAGEHSADVNLAGGALTVLAQGKMAGMVADGDLGITGALSGTVHQVISTDGQGADVQGAYSHTAGSATMLGLGGTGLTASNVNGDPTAATLAGDASLLGGASLPQAGVGSYGLKAAGAVQVEKGSHTALAVSGSVDAAVSADGPVTVDGVLMASGAGAAAGLSAFGGTVTVADGMLDARGANGVQALDVQVDAGILNAIGHGATGLVSSPDATVLNKLLKGLSSVSAKDVAAVLADFLTGDDVLVKPTSGLKAGVLSLAGSDASVAGAADAQLPGLSAALDAAVAAAQTAGVDDERTGLLAEIDVVVDGGTVNAFGVPATLRDGSEQAGGVAYGVRAGGSVTVNGGTTVALGKTKDGAQATGIGAESLAANGGTVTAYGFPSAAKRMSVETYAGTQVATGLKVAAGESAPGAQVDPATSLADHAYACVTDGALLLDEGVMGWDSLDTSSLAIAAAFDPADGRNKMSKEMLTSIIGLNRMTMIMSGGADLAKGSFVTSLLDAYAKSQALGSQNPTSTLHFGPMIEGTGAALMFENGPLFGGESALHHVNGVDVYDLGSRYDAQPELDGLKALMPDKKELVHSVRFNYEGELPGSATVLMAVGDAWKSKPVEWAYSDHAFKALTTIASQEVDPFGVLEVAGQKALHRETAIIGDENVGPEPPNPPKPPMPNPPPEPPAPPATDGPTSDPKPVPADKLAPTGDWAAPATWALLGVLAIAAGAVAVSLRRSRHR